jgi:murein DD-endopeptidase MepM/ murein hydrolase activator NlpD
MYGNDREWGTDSTGITSPSTACYLAEGCTLPGFETWVLVQNPGPGDADVSMRLLTDSGEVTGPIDTVPAGRRRTYNLSKYAPGSSVATIVSAGAPVVVERAMYGGKRLWGTCAQGCTALSDRWYLAEGCTEKGFETWLTLVNPGDAPVNVAVKLQTENGEVDGPSGVIEPRRRKTFNLGEFVTSYNVAALVEANGAVSCERPMYGEGTNRRLCAPVEGLPLYPFTRDGSVACGHWPTGSLDYPYFGAPREGTRLHAGIDIYPPSGAGAPVRALRAGTVVKTGLFYTRYTGERTFAVLVDHGDFVANYAELWPLDGWVQPGAAVSRGQVIGFVSGTEQLHFEMYAPGTTSWLWWYGPQPSNLIDPTDMILRLY